jgi:hypothetical protein
LQRDINIFPSRAERVERILDIRQELVINTASIPSEPPVSVSVCPEQRLGTYESNEEVAEGEPREEQADEFCPIRNHEASWREVLTIQELNVQKELPSE